LQNAIKNTIAQYKKPYEEFFIFFRQFRGILVLETKYHFLHVICGAVHHGCESLSLFLGIPRKGPGTQSSSALGNGSVEQACENGAYDIVIYFLRECKIRYKCSWLPVAVLFLVYFKPTLT
jgi:hypothetical protein